MRRSSRSICKTDNDDSSSLLWSVHAGSWVCTSYALAPTALVQLTLTMLWFGNRKACRKASILELSKGDDVSSPPTGSIWLKYLMPMEYFLMYPCNTSLHALHRQFCPLLMACKHAHRTRYCCDCQPLLLPTYPLPSECSTPSTALAARLPSCKQCVSLSTGHLSLCFFSPSPPLSSRL